MSYIAGDFSFVQSSYEVEMLEDGYETITKLDLWKWLAEYIPEENKGFMFSENENISKIVNTMKIGHSGATFGWIMRHMEMIAKKGWEYYVNVCLNNQNK